MKTTIISNIPESLYWKLKVHASSKGKSLSAFIIESLERHIIAYEKKKGINIPDSANLVSLPCAGADLSPGAGAGDDLVRGSQIGGRV